MNLTPLDFLLIALAACYWAFVIPKKPGPYRLFEKIRSRVTFGGLLLCPPCLVFWISILFWLAWQTPLHPIVTISAIAGGATVIGYYTGTWMQ